MTTDEDSEFGKDLNGYYNLIILLVGGERKLFKFEQINENKDPITVKDVKIQICKSWPEGQ